MFNQDNSVEKEKEEDRRTDGERWVAPLCPSVKSSWPSDEDKHFLPLREQHLGCEFRLQLLLLLRAYTPCVWECV